MRHPSHRDAKKYRAESERELVIDGAFTKTQGIARKGVLKDHRNPTLRTGQMFYDMALRENLIPLICEPD